MTTTAEDIDMDSDAGGPKIQPERLVKPPKPFDGRRATLDEWFLKYDIYFDFVGDELSGRQRCLLMAQNLEGDAYRWVQSQLREYFSANPSTEVTRLFTREATFKSELRRVFGISNEANIAIRHVQYDRQVKSASEYAAQFQRWAPLTGWDDHALRDMFYRGLKDTVKDQLIHCGFSTNTLADMMTAAIDLDDKIYERLMEKKRSYTPRQNGPYKNKTTYRDPDRMELDFTKREGVPNKQKGKYNDKKKKTFECYACGKPGHIARNCRSKGLVPQQPALMMMRREGSAIIDSDDETYVNVTDGESESDYEDLGTQVDPDVIPGGDGPGIDRNESPETTASSQSQNEEEYLRQRETIPRAFREAFNYAFHQGIKELQRFTEKLNQHTQDITGNELPLDQRIVMGSHAEQRYHPFYDYRHDERNPRHIDLWARECKHERCAKHDYPVPRKRVVRRSEHPGHWMDCTTHWCEDHLMDKRHARHFPGMTGRDKAIMEADELLENTWCGAPYWQTCLAATCQFHKLQKRLHGFSADFPELDPAPEDGAPCLAARWKECYHDACWYHLRPKRFADVFPKLRGRSVRYQTGSCKSSRWETCWNKDHIYHQEQLRRYYQLGTGHTQPDEKDHDSGKD